MPRRASSKVKPVWIAVVAVAVALAIGLGSALENQDGDPFRTVAELNLSNYLNNASSLRGNIYKVKGTISQSLAYSRIRGHLFSVDVGSGAESNVIPTLIPPDLSYLTSRKAKATPSGWRSATPGFSLRGT